jgi:H+-transporting ATPase
MTSQGQSGSADTRRRSSRISRASLSGDWNSLDEYGKLVKYVSTFRESDAQDQEGGEVAEKRVWYAPWKKRKVRVKKVEDEIGKFPDEWTMTDIRKGLSSDEVPVRRRRAGWNELTSEKENPIAKILSYFRGPILYGKSLLAPGLAISLTLVQ